MTSDDAAKEQTGRAALRALQAKIAVDKAAAAHGLTASQIPLLLELPPIAAMAVTELQDALGELAALIARLDGDDWTRLPLDRKEQLLRHAFDLVAEFGRLAAQSLFDDLP